MGRVNGSDFESRLSKKAVIPGIGALVRRRSAQSRAAERRTLSTVEEMGAGHWLAGGSGLGRARWPRADVSVQAQIFEFKRGLARERGKRGRATWELKRKRKQGQQGAFVCRGGGGWAVRQARRMAIATMSIFSTRIVGRPAREPGGRGRRARRNEESTS